MSRLRSLAALTAGMLALGTLALTAPLSSPAAAEPTGGRGTLAAPDRSLLDGLGDNVEERRSALPDAGRHAFLLELETRSTGRAYKAAKSAGGAAAAASARAQLGRVDAAQDSVVRALPAHTPVLYRIHAALAGVAVRTNVANVPRLERIPGVAKVRPIAPKYLDNSYAVGMQGAPAAWQGNASLGADMTIAVIDTGIDFTHATFGGVGTPAAYDTERGIADSGSLVSSSFPTAKVIGGYDLVGNAYTGSGAGAVAHPDPNPLDCNGHGTHVAGTAAGLGITSAGATYAGTYDSATDLRAMRVGAGMAPRAKLMAFKIFGCTGSTAFASDAIDMALDPNGDGSIADAVDVMNLSLGSKFGTTDDGDTAVADAAAAQGVSMVFSAGNDYDLYDVGGSPGTSQRGLTVAASADASNVLDGLAVTYSGGGGATFGGLRALSYNWTLPDLAGDIAVAPGNALGCTPFTGADAAAIAGKVALLSWTSGASECSSTLRANNVALAGGVGFVVTETAPVVAGTINGNAAIPGIVIGANAGSVIRAKISGGETVTVTGTSRNGAELLTPAEDDTMADFSSRGIRGDGHLKPDVAAVGESVFSAGVGTGDGGKNIGGTSMAAPTVAGLAALVRSAHPAWNPEQVKAAIMNTAGQDLDTNGSGAAGGDRYAPNRVGAGRIQADKAVATDLLAYVVQDPGAVSVSFGPVEVTGPTTLTKTVRVQNTHPTLARSFTASYDPTTTIPGVSYDLAVSSPAIPAGESEQVTVTLRIDDPSLLTKTVDATHGRSAAGNPLEFLADASGNLVITPSGGLPTLRVPVYSAPRPASVMTQPDALGLSGGVGTLTLDGQDVDQGTGAEHVDSTVAGFELQATSGLAPTCAAPGATACILGPTERGADIEHVGVTSDAPAFLDPSADGIAYFGISTHGPHSTAAGKVEFQVLIDTDRDGDADVLAYTTRVTERDIFLTVLVDVATDTIIDQQATNHRLGDVDTAIYDSDVLMLPVRLTELALYGVNAANPRVDYAVMSYGDGLVDEIGGTAATATVDGSLSADLFAPGVRVTGTGIDGGLWGMNLPTGPLLEDRDGANLTVRRNATSYTADGGLGLLMLHFHNEVGDKAQIVRLGDATTTALGATPDTLTLGQSTTLTVTVDDPAGPTAPTGTVTVTDTSTNAVVASGPLAAGIATLTYAPTTLGAQDLEATYAGDSAYLGSTSTPVTLTVNAPAGGGGGGGGSPTATPALTLSPSTVARGTEVGLGITVAGTGATPTGAVSVKDADSGAVVATGTLADGAATLRFTPTAAGTRRLVATYAGDSRYAAATSPAATLTVTPAARAVTLTASAKSVVRGGQVLLTVGVVQEAGDPVPTGSVSIADGSGATVATGTLGPEGWVLLPYRPTRPGTVQLRATYAGDAQTVGSGPSSAVQLRVTRANARLALSLDAKRGRVGEPAGASVTVDVVRGIPASGEVLLRAGRRTLDTATLVDGTARFSFTPAQVGKLELRVVYAGDATYRPGASDPKTFRVRPRLRG